jgi:hypothetical protein
MRAYDLRTADRRYRRPSRDYSPRSAAIGRFRQKKNRAGFYPARKIKFFGSMEIKTHIIPDLLCLPFYRRTRFADKLSVLVRSLPSFGLQIREGMPCFGCERLLKTTDQGLIQGVASFVSLFRL